jgi:hypothetical protein
MWRITNEQLRANARRAYDEGRLRWFAIAADVLCVDTETAALEPLDPLAGAGVDFAPAGWATVAKQTARARSEWQPAEPLAKPRPSGSSPVVASAQYLYIPKSRPAP